MDVTHPCAADCDERVAGDERRLPEPVVGEPARLAEPRRLDDIVADGTPPATGICHDSNGTANQR
jgi:hypothetical protein